jgi:glutamate 5-kinase
VAEAAEVRRSLASCRRIVVKIGSKSLAGDAWDRLASEVLAARRGAGSGTKRAAKEGRTVVIVSSGAIALGVEKLALGSRPKDMARLQAAAAAGQSVLMQRYEDAFGKVGLKVAQVLLTHADLADRTRANNARNALAALLAAGAVPIINENDAVAVEEIKFGDNDQLASMVTPLCDADLLLLLSDVDGLLDHDKQRVPFVQNVAREARHLAGGAISGVGTGGMASKVEAARRATLAGAYVVIAKASEAGVLGRVLAGEDIGTLFAAAGEKLPARKYWIAYTLRPRGAILLDRGACAAVIDKHKSVLSIGVLGVRGAFQPGDSVSVLDPSGAEIARGLVRLSAAEAARVAYRKGEPGSEEELVHRDDLVILPAE